MLGKKNRTDLETGERERIKDKTEEKNCERQKERGANQKTDRPRPYSGWMRETRMPGSWSERRLSLCPLPKGYRDRGVPMAKPKGRRG